MRCGKWDGHSPFFVTKFLKIVSLTSVSFHSYRKDREQSDSMDPPCELIKLPWIYRKALLVLNNMEV